MTCRRRIDDVLRSAYGRNIEIPEPDEKKRWLRFPCPACGRDRAAINYQAGVFKCHHKGCKATAVTGDSYTATRFRPQINQAVRNTRQKYRAWLSKEDVQDLRQHGYLLAAEYERDGQLDTWEADVMGDPDQLDRFVLRALNCDLANAAQALCRRKRREVLQDEDASGQRTQVGATQESVEDRTIWLSWPTLALLYRHRMTHQEIADRLGVDVRTVQRRIKRELADARDTYTSAT